MIKKKVFERKDISNKLILLVLIVLIVINLVSLGLYFSLVGGEGVKSFRGDGEESEGQSFSSGGKITLEVARPEEGEGK